MKDLVSAAPMLLNDLYERATAPEHWPDFLGKFASFFHSDTATIRLTDLHDPVVYQSFTVGFRQRVNQRYESETTALELDPFRLALADSPIGKALNSQDIISDRDFERSEHYQNVFHPNGNFYAMGTQFERESGRALHIGIHRPKQRGSFTQEEMASLELFSPHLRRVAGLSHLLAELNQIVTTARMTLDQLTFGVWHMDGKLRVQWMNSFAEEALATGTYGLRLQGNRIQLNHENMSGALATMVRKLTENQSLTEVLPLGQTGACLIIMQSHQSDTGFHIGRALAPRILCFLLDSGRPAQLDQQQLAIMYQLTPAEYRLVSLLVNGMDVNEASALLQISPHTGRTQLKSIMQKTGVNRQANLQRKLLLCADTLRKRNE